MAGKEEFYETLRYFAAEQFLVVPYAGFVAQPSEAVAAIAARVGIAFEQTWQPGAMKEKNAKTPGDQTLDLADHHLRGL